MRPLPPAAVVKSKPPYDKTKPWPDAVAVWPPESKAPEYHSRENARDLVRLNGWSEGPQIVKTATAAAKADAQTLMDDLRAEASRLAIRVDSSWGHKKLQKEIDAVKSASVIPDVVKKMEEVARLQAAEDATDAELEEATRPD